jgi:hypothetical protein
MLIGKSFKFRLFAFFAGYRVLYKDVNQIVRGSALSFTSLME